MNSFTHDEAHYTHWAEVLILGLTAFLSGKVEFLDMN